MEERQFYAGRWRTLEQIENVKEKRKIRMSEAGWNGERVEQNIYRRSSGRYFVHLSVRNKSVKKTFDTIEEARAWRDEQSRARPKRVYKSRGLRRFVSGGISTLHRSTWEPADYEMDRQIIRDQLESANRVEVQRDGMEFTVIELPYIAPVKPTDWTDADAHRISTKRIKAAVFV